MCVHVRVCVGQAKIERKLLLQRITFQKILILILSLILILIIILILKSHHDDGTMKYTKQIYRYVLDYIKKERQVILNFSEF